MSMPENQYLLESLLNRATLRMPRDVGYGSGYGDLIRLGRSLGICDAPTHRKAELVRLCAEAIQDSVDAFVSQGDLDEARTFLDRKLDHLFSRAFANFWFEMSERFHGEAYHHGRKPHDKEAFIYLCIDHLLYKADAERVLSRVELFIEVWLGRPDSELYLRVADPEQCQPGLGFSLRRFVVHTLVRPVTDEGRVNLGYLYRAIGDWFDLSIDETSRRGLRVERAPFPDWAINQLCRTEEHSAEHNWSLPRTMAFHPAVSDRLHNSPTFQAVVRSLWSEYRAAYGTGETEVGIQVSETDRALSATFLESLPTTNAPLDPPF